MPNCCASFFKPVLMRRNAPHWDEVQRKWHCRTIFLVPMTRSSSQRLGEEVGAFLCCPEEVMMFFSEKIDESRNLSSFFSNWDGKWASESDFTHTSDAESGLVLFVAPHTPIEFRGEKITLKHMYYLLRWILENLLRRKFAESVPPHRELFQLIESFNFLTPCREAVKYMKLFGFWIEDWRISTPQKWEK